MYSYILCRGRVFVTIEENVTPVFPDSLRSDIHGPASLSPSLSRTLSLFSPSSASLLLWSIAAVATREATQRLNTPGAQ